MSRDKRRQVLRLPGAHHRSDDGDEVRQQGRRSSSELDNQVKVYNEFKNGELHGRAEAGVREQDRRARRPRPRWRGTSRPSARSGARGTGDQKTMALAAYLYKKVVDTWNAEEFAKFEFPRIVKEDWPTIYKIKYAMADLLYFQKDWAECGPAFDAVVAENPTGARGRRGRVRRRCSATRTSTTEHAQGRRRQEGQRQPARRAARRATRTTKADEARSSQPKDFTDSQKGMITAFNRYICYIKPAASDKAGAGAARRGEVRARAHLLRGAALGGGGARLPRHRDEPLRQGRRHLRRAALPRERQRPRRRTSSRPRPSCFDDMAADVPKFIELYCAGDKATKNAGAVRDPHQDPVSTSCASRRRSSSSAPTRAAATRRSRSTRRAATAYLEMFRRSTARMPLSEQPAAAVREAATRSSTTRRAPSRRRASSRRRSRARMILLDSDVQAEARLDAREEGDATRSAATTRPSPSTTRRPTGTRSTPKTDPKARRSADKALSRRGRPPPRSRPGGPGHRGRASCSRKNYGGAKPAQTAAIAFAIGAHYVEKEDWDKARRRARRRRWASIDKARARRPGPGARDARRARYAKLKRRRRARKGEYAKVRGSGATRRAAEAKINDAYPSEDDGAAAIAGSRKALNAVGEAFFFAAEEQRKAEVDTIKFPEYKGPGNKDDVLKHIKTKVKDWYDEEAARRSRRSSPSTQKIVELQPVAAAAVGHRRRLARRSDVGRLRRRVPPRADPEGRGKKDVPDGTSAASP